MVLGWVWSAVSDIAVPIVRAASTVVAAPGGCAVRISETRTHLEIRRVHEPGSGEAGGNLEQRLKEVDGVHRAEINAVLGFAMVDHEPSVGADELQGVITRAERELDRVLRGVFVEVFVTGEGCGESEESR